MSVSFEEIGHLSATFRNIGSVPGAVGKVNFQGNTANCMAGDPFLGVTESVSGYYAAVQIAGFAWVSYSGSNPGNGYCKLSADGQGGVKLDDNGRGYWVVRVDTENKKLNLKL